MCIGPLSNTDFTHATFTEFRSALRGAFPLLSEEDADNAILNLWARIMMARLGVKL